jgi:hypothetical protein
VSDYFLPDQRFWAAFLAIWRRWLDESFAARAFPPLEAPRRPSATAAGFFFRGPAGMKQLCHKRDQTSAPVDDREISQESRDALQEEERWANIIYKIKKMLVMLRVNLNVVRVVNSPYRIEQSFLHAVCQIKVVSKLLLQRNPGLTIESSPLHVKTHRLVVGIHIVKFL